MTDSFEAQLQREWLLTNGRGGFASGTCVGVPTRRYHGLLVAAARPPLERWMLLSALFERVGVNGVYEELAGFEFHKTFHPRGFAFLRDFTVSNNPEHPFACFTYETDQARVRKLIVMPRGRDEVVVRYRVDAPPNVPVSLEVCPFVAMRDFHGLTHAFEEGFPFEQSGEHVAVDGSRGGPRLWLHVRCAETGAGVGFEPRPDWWYGFRYRAERARGQDHREDLFMPGWFRTDGNGVIDAVLTATADFSGGRAPAPAPSVPPSMQRAPADSPPVEDRLREAAAAFVVARRAADGDERTTILAGYPWFGDWGRDTFIAMPGLLLETGRFVEARQVLEVFASAQQDGLIPNRFSDYGDGCDYNSVDASLWYIHAADAYCAASGDKDAWRTVLGPACDRVVEAFVRGTRYNIHLDGDGLVACGDAWTQLTWMDAKYGDVAFTPRHGKPVEINALWYHALCAMARRAGGDDVQRAARYRELAERTAEMFNRRFWNAESGCLYDTVRDGGGDPAIRPNQVLAVSLPDSMLEADRQRAVVAVVERELLTPYGLRSLARGNRQYRGRYEGGPFERDSAYHQGTVWGWLIGPYVEAYLRVHGFSPEAKATMRTRLAPLAKHLDEAGIGSVSEVFDGDPPHTPRGCIAQAWSVAELLRAWRMTETGTSF